MDKPTPEQLKETWNILDYILAYLKKNEPDATKTISAIATTMDCVSEDMFDDE